MVCYIQEGEFRALGHCWGWNEGTGSFREKPARFVGHGSSNSSSSQEQVSSVHCTSNIMYWVLSGISSNGDPFFFLSTFLNKSFFSNTNTTWMKKNCNYYDNNEKYKLTTKLARLQLCNGRNKLVRQCDILHRQRPYIDSAPFNATSFWHKRHDTIYLYVPPFKIYPATLDCRYLFVAQHRLSKLLSESSVGHWTERDRPTWNEREHHNKPIRVEEKKKKRIFIHSPYVWLSYMG